MVSMHFFTEACIMHNVYVHVCLLDAAISNQMWITESGMGGGDKGMWQLVNI